MSTASFDISVRTLECARCGAPIGAAPNGGETVCRYCGATNVVRRRVMLSERRTAPTMAEEIARRSRLSAQLEHPLGSNPYDLRRAPLGLAVSKLDTLRDAWKIAKERASSSPRLLDAQRDLVWLALHLSEAERRASNLVAARAVLETALDLLDDEGHRHLVACRIVTEAVRDRDLPSAEAWLAECDPRAEVLELDGAYRKAKARLETAKQTHGVVLDIVGARAGDVPIAVEYAMPLGFLRAEALEALGRDDAAFAEVAALRETHGEGAVMTQLAESGFARRALGALRRGRLAAASSSRDALPVGFRALDGALWPLPLFAAGLLLVVTIPRCTFDADPFLGVHGDVLCPYACKGCQGPFRIYTSWSHNGGEHSTNGPQYYCQSADNRIGTMTAQEFEAARFKLGAYELSWAPAAATYLTFVVLLLPLAVVSGVKRHRASLVSRATIDERVAELAAEAGEPIPDRIEPPTSVAGFGLLAAAVVVPLLVIVAELALRR